MTSNKPFEHSLPAHNTRLLYIYLYMRIVIGLLLMAIQLSGTKTIAEHESYTWFNASYIALCILTLIIWPPQRLKQSEHRLIGSLLFDVSIILILMLFSGGLAGGLNYVLLIYIAVASIFLRGRLSLLYAAMASVVIIGNSVYSTLYLNSKHNELFASGMLGAVLFATSFTFQFLTERLHASGLIAEAQSRHAENLQKLAQAIITRMRTGVIVLDDDGKIEFINDSALQLMDLPQSASYRQTQLAEITILQSLVQDWINQTVPLTAKVQKLPSGHEVRISPAVLAFDGESRTVLYLEDHRALTQQAQQLKLASLGGLTASIAHEIRNPLGAISHATQLLEESESIPDADKRLLQIILQHTSRVNEIIENTLSLSRRKEIQAKTINLTQWLPQFKETYEQSDTTKVHLTMAQDEIPVRIDTSHLTQVLTNLCDNGGRYNAMTTGINEVQLFAGINNNTDTSYIEIVDNGPGIAEEYINEIFNPFFTTENTGTGLGLYICKELCEINQAILLYKPSTKGSTCFRIDFTHHQRMN